MYFGDDGSLKYFLLLQRRQKWIRSSRNFCTEDIVLLADPSLPRGLKPKAIPVHPFPDRENLVWRVRERTLTSSFLLDDQKYIFLRKLPS